MVNESLSRGRCIDLRGDIDFHHAGSRTKHAFPTLFSVGLGADWIYVHIASFLRKLCVKNDAFLMVKRLPAAALKLTASPCHIHIHDIMDNAHLRMQYTQLLTFAKEAGR